MKAALIVNPVAGQGRGLKVLPRLKSKLCEANFDISTFVTEKKGDATSFARKARENLCELVIVLGGDGTVFEAVNGIVGSDVALGLIPSGTGDVLAHELGIPTHNPTKAIQILLTGRKRKIDVGKANGKHFILMAGIGFDAQVVSEVKPEVKRILKDLAYPLTGLKTLLTYKPSLLKVVIDGKKEREGYFVVVGNARHYAGRFSITQKASICDGMLDICIFKSGSITSFVKYVQNVIVGRHLKLSDVDYYQGRNVYVSAAQGEALVQVDGELLGKTPMNFTLLPKSLTVVAPDLKR